MKKKLYLFLLLSILLLLGAHEVTAQAPQSFLYQAEARNSRGRILVEESLSVKVTILQESTEVYQERHSVQTDKNGLFNLNIGKGEHLYGDLFSEIEWEDGTFYLDIQIAVGVSNNYVSMGTIQLLSVPYALHASTSQSAREIDFYDVKNVPLDLLDGDDRIDDDDDPANEIQTIEIAGNIITLSDGGGSIELPAVTTVSGQYFYVDRDRDEFGDAYNAVFIPFGVTEPEFYVSNPDDCDDSDSSVNPDAEEIANDNIDNDCDGRIDILDGRDDVDDDGDGFTEDDGDCDDTNTAIYPGSEEVCDGLDNDCDGKTDPDCNVEDSEGNSYRIREIGNQIWITENLKSTKFRNGSNLPLVSDDTEWKNLKTGAFCYYNNDESRGILYNWYAVSEGNLCPLGFHVPTYNDWKELVDYCGGWSPAGKKLSLSGSNETGFSSVNGGTREDYYGGVRYLGYVGAYHVLYPTRYDDNYKATYSYRISIYNSGYSSGVSVNSYPSWHGYSIRCVKQDIDATDLDNDDYYSDVDCNDSDAEIYPNSQENCGDGIDQDCNGDDLNCDNIDLDGDGFSAYNGDCNDEDNSVYPGATETCGDNIDQNCADGDLACDDFIGRLENGETVLQLLDEGYSLVQIFEGGVLIGVMLEQGITEQQLFDSGLMGTLTDIENITYKWLRIGDQYWMAENLRSTKLNDESSISLVIDNDAWSSLTTPGLCWISSDVEDQNTYGALYNWHAVSTTKLCPAGWHVPTETEWGELISFLGGGYTAGGKLRESGFTHWVSGTSAGFGVEGNNESGFTALGGGYRKANGEFTEHHQYWTVNTRHYWGQFWSATESTTTNSVSYLLSYINDDIVRYIRDKKYASSVRCLKD